MTPSAPGQTKPTDPAPQYAGFVERLAYAHIDRALKRPSPSVIFNRRPLPESEMRRMVAYARRHGFLK